MVILKLFWLGPPAVELDGHPLRLEMRKTLALLAYLSLSPQKPTRETLASLFWPDNDQQHALSSLRRNLFSLARSLPPGFLEADREKIGLQREHWLYVDVEEFKEQLAFAREHAHPPNRICPDCLSSLNKAVAVYKGEFLEGFNLKDCPEFDGWQFFQRESLRSEYAQALEKLSAHYQGQGEWEQAIRYARSWLALDRLNEPAQRMLIGLYNQSGQRNVAIWQYDEFSRELDEQLGQSPEPETIRLVHQVSLAETAPSRETSRSSFPPAITPVLKTKLYIPSARSKRVTRNRLLALLEESAARELTLVSAPAGYGKTTLLAEWAATTQLPIAWISLDAADNDPNCFLTYVSEAINSVHPGVGDYALEMLRSSVPLPPAAVVSTLLNDLCEVTEPFVLVLDDYHLITVQAVHNAVTFMLDHLLPVIHLVIATRIDPPLPLARLRSHQQLAEIRASHLRFNPEETAELLNRIMGLDLKEEDILSLESRTEGWIAGLQMAVLSMQGRQDLSQFIQSFTGSHRYIMDYLVDEVLLRQPEDIQKFLLNTSILKRLSGPLCDALLDQKGSQATLENLEKANLFLVSLDNDRKWYRYHHLFADLLNARLEQQSLEKIPELNVRCSKWYEANRFMDEAVEHALAARDYVRACRLIDQLAGPMISRSAGFILQGWIEQLPPEIAVSRPWLCISQAWVRMATGLIDQVEPLLQAAERRIRPDDPPRVRQEWLGHIAFTRAYLADFCGNVPGTIEMAEQALELLPIDDFANREKVVFILGRAYLNQGQLSEGIMVLSENIRQSIEAGTVNMIAPSLATLSKIYRIQGRLHDVIDLLHDGRRYIETCDARRVFLAGNAYVDPAGVLREWNDLEAAETTARHALDLTYQWENPSATCTAYIVLARVFQSQGQLDAAVDALHSAEAAVRGRIPFSDVLGDLKAAQVKLWLAMGELSKASQWAQDLEKNLDPNAAFSIAREQDEITLSRVLIAKQLYERAFQILSRLAETSEIGGRNGRLIEILVLQATTLFAQKKEPEALKVIEHSLVLARPEGYLRVFLDAGEPMKELLSAYLLTSAPTHGAYAQKLLDAFNRAT
jgi:LuxR family transcriptional regulator, maltose regulon positive regulatory protein